MFPSDSSVPRPRTCFKPWASNSLCERSFEPTARARRVRQRNQRSTIYIKTMPDNVLQPAAPQVPLDCKLAYENQGFRLENVKYGF